jgi:hypothetical protein
MPSSSSSNAVAVDYPLGAGGSTQYRMWISAVTCVGNETNLGECDILFTSHLNPTCIGYQAGVMCEGRFVIFFNEFAFFFIRCI